MEPDESHPAQAGGVGDGAEEESGVGGGGGSGGSGQGAEVPYVPPLTYVLSAVHFGRAHLAFERALTPEVKGMMKKHFPDEGDDFKELKAKLQKQDNDRRTAMQEWASKLEEAEASTAKDKQRHINTAKKELLKLRGLDASVDRAKSLRSRLEEQGVNVAELLDLGLTGKDLEQKLEQSARTAVKIDRSLGSGVWRSLLQAERERLSQASELKNSVLWLQKCRQTCGKASASHMKADDETWDVFKLVQILTGYLKDVFAPNLGLSQKYRVKGLLNSLLEVQEARNRRAHNVLPTDEEVLDSLYCMKDVLALFGKETEVTEVSELIAEAEELVGRAERAELQEGAAGEELRMKTEDAEALVS